MHAIVARLVQIRNEITAWESAEERPYRLFGVMSAPEMALDESATGVAGTEAGFMVLRDEDAAM